MLIGSFAIRKESHLPGDELRRGPVVRDIDAGQFDPSFIITHRLPLEEAPTAYKTFRDKEEGCIKSC